jgi:transcriptional regulator with XRE-family HTH domain
LRVIAKWTGGYADALRRAMRLTYEDFAEHLSVSVRQVNNWHSRPEIIPQAKVQRILDGALDSASDRVKAQFALLVSEANGNAAGIAESLSIPLDAMTSHEWTRDDAYLLSRSFDAALERSAVEDIERLAHMWLIAEPPQIIELDSGRRISDDLVATVEHRVIQLRRADDFITGPTSHDLVWNELHATTHLLTDAALTEDQARRLLTATGELAQLGAWVAADAGLLENAARYVRGGVLASRAALNAPLAANIISTFSYQVANNGNPREAAILARTAYQGAQHDATPIARALLLERVAWASAKSGDLLTCERTLGQVEDAFSGGPRDNDPDWVYWLNREEIDVMAGRCYTELHQPGKAERLLSDAISRYNQTLIRENSLYLSWLTEDYIQLGEIDHAAELAARMAALAARTNSARTDTRLRYLAGQLAQYKDTASVAEFFDAYQSAAHDGDGERSDVP